jgi:LEA14-like dessication related protein
MFRRTLFFLGFLALAGIACGGAQPRVNVLGLSTVRARGASPSLVVVVDIHNPTGTQLVLSGLDYHFQADPWFQASGTVTLRRALPAGSSATVEIPLSLEKVAEGVTEVDAISYRLEGRLRAFQGPVEVTYRVDTSGRVAPQAVPSSIRVQAWPGTLVSQRAVAHD